jgi:signal transduction histidine kinase
MVDYSRVQSILVNLISNAVKFSESGNKIQVKLKEYATINSKKEIGVGISISDSGPGISPKD